MGSNARSNKEKTNLDRNELFPELIEVDPRLKAELYEEAIEFKLIVHRSLFLSDTNCLITDIITESEKIAIDIRNCIRNCKTEDDLKKLNSYVKLLYNNPVLRFLRQRFLNEHSN